MAEDSEVGWTPWKLPGQDSDRPRAWHKSRAPYYSDSNNHQNVDIWVTSIGGSFLKNSGPWIIYIHGGAWRDPLVDSGSFNATVNHILSDKSDLKDKVGGIASINYSLSPHPFHPTFPAPVPSPGVEGIVGRSAKHPDHIVDVLNAIGFLDSEFGFGKNYILVGHSCGATLALQAVMDRSLWKIASAAHTSTIEDVLRPIAVVGLNGLYDLPALIAQPDDKHLKLQKDYETFTSLAFGNDKKAWASVSPTSVADWTASWPDGKQIVLAQSHSDGLVSYNQTELMFENLRQSTGTTIKVQEMDADGDHNDLWKNGDRIAEILKAVVESL